MKGTIVKCLEDLVKAKAGADKWRQALTKAGRPPTTQFMTTEIVPDGDVVKLIDAVASVLGITLAQAMDAFGEYWSTKYAPDIYGIYFSKAKNAREFLLNLDQVHVAMTKTAGANPPRFTYTWKSERDLVMTYKSPRGLVALMPGLLRGVAKYYKEHIDVTLVGNDVTIRFDA
jgi:hypothetical protein